MVQIKHVWFDCDGTLYVSDEFEAVRENVIYTNLANRLGLSEAEIGILSKDVQEKKKIHKSLTTTLKIEYKVPEDETRTWYSSVNPKKYIKRDSQLVDTIQGILEKGIPASIFTNNKRMATHEILILLGLNPNWFKFVMPSEEVLPKPAIEGYKEIIRRSECDPRQIIYVADNEQKEIVPARSVGMNTMLAWSNRSETSLDPEFRTSHFKRPTVYEITDVIAAINSPAPK